MALFALWTDVGTMRHDKIAAGYQNLFNDKGNWTQGSIGKGIQAGTNMSISAYWRSGYEGREFTASEMRALTKAQALDYFKRGFWDAVRGDEINNQLIANIIADMKSSAGGNAIKELQKAISSISTPIQIDGAFGTQTLNAINQLDASRQIKLYNKFRENMINYYTRIGIGNNAVFKNTWIRILNKYYPPQPQPTTTTNFLILLAGAGIALLS
jgi:lysozyme family protein